MRGYSLIILSFAFAGISVFSAPWMNARSGEKGQKQGTQAVLKATQNRIAKTKAVNPFLLERDYLLIANVFDERGVPLKFTKDPPKEKLVAALVSKDPDSPLDVAASAWFDLRVVGKKVSKEEPLTSAILTAAVEEMVRLTVRSKPSGGKVYLRTSDNHVGSTEVKRWVAPGKVRIWIVLADHEDYDVEIDVPNKNHIHTATLVKK